jgi:hypothetical protein
MNLLTIVEHLNPFYNRSFCNLSSDKALSMHKLCFEGSKKALSHCIIPTIPFSTHTTANSCRLECCLVITTGILAAPPQSEIATHMQQEPGADGAALSAASTKSTRMCSAIDHPTIRRENRSIITAKYNQP